MANTDPWSVPDAPAADDHRSRRAPAGANRAAKAAAVVTTVFCASMVCALTCFGLSTHWRMVVSNVCQCVGPLVAVCWIVVSLPRPGRQSRPESPAQPAKSPWPSVLLALGIAGYALGQIIWTCYEVFLRWNVPFPSWADAGYLSAYPFLFLGVLMLPRDSVSASVRARIVLDTSIVILAIVTFSWYFVLGPTLLQANETLLAKVVGTAYPVFDVVLLSLVVFTLTRGNDRGVSIGLPLGLGLISIAFSDTIFAFQTLHNTYESGRFVDAGWPFGYMLVGVAALSAIKTPVSNDKSVTEPLQFTAMSRAHRLAVTLLPYLVVPAIAALVWRIAVSHGDRQLEFGVFVSAFLVVATLLIRQFLAIAENERLAGQLQAFNEDLELSNAALAEARDKALSATRSKSTFLSAMSPEITKPMQQVMSLTAGLLDMDLGSDQRKLAVAIRTSCDRVMSVLNDIQDFGLIETGRLKLEKAPIELRTVLDNLALVFGPQADEKRVKLVFHVCSGVPSHVVGDRARVSQVLTNLLANAIKYTPAGEIVLTLSVVEEAPDYVILRIEVADTGIGLSAYAQSRIFQPFSKVTAASVHEYRDSALGLAICKQLAVMMGGTMGVQSAEGHGSTFWFTVKLGLGENAAAAGQPTDWTGARVVSGAEQSAAMNRPAA